MDFRGDKGSIVRVRRRQFFGIDCGPADEDTGNLSVADLFRVDDPSPRLRLTQRPHPTRANEVFSRAKSGLRPGRNEICGHRVVAAPNHNNHGVRLTTAFLPASLLRGSLAALLLQELRCLP